ncbi:MAG: site-2 protease family protein [Gammaproteobacteria bacterium]
MGSTQFSNFVQIISIAAIPILFAITVHEVAHGWMAKNYGDRTAEMLGRLTLNPIKHIDPVGTVLVPLLMVWIGGFIFGWAKPVPVSPRNLRNPKRDMVPVALAGPGANLLMAIIWAALLKGFEFAQPMLGGTAFFFIQMAKIGIFFNILLMIFNLLPIPPLDGGRVLRGLVPESIGHRLDALERYGLIIVVGLIVAGLLSPVIALARRLSAMLGAF